jgi:hypothetical protein
VCAAGRSYDSVSSPRRGLSITSLAEDEARNRDRTAEDIHHYQHMLIKEVRRVYEDLNASEPKKYGYGEWAYFLELLVEDEEVPKYHRKAPLKLENNDLKKSTDNSSAVTAEEQEVDKSQDGGQKHAASEASENDRTGKKIK